MLLNSYIYTGTFYGPLSVRINGVDCLDLQDLAGGGGGGEGVGVGGSAHNSRALSLSTSFLNGPVNYDRQSTKLLSRRGSLALCS